MRCVQPGAATFIFYLFIFIYLQNLTTHTHITASQTCLKKIMLLCILSNAGLQESLFKTANN